MKHKHKSKVRELCRMTSGDIALLVSPLQILQFSKNSVGSFTQTLNHSTLIKVLLMLNKMQASSRGNINMQVQMQVPTVQGNII